MHKRRIAIATWYPDDPERPHGGVESVSVILAQALAARGDLDVHVVSFSRMSTPALECAAGLTIHRLPRGEEPLLLFVRGRGQQLLEKALHDLQPDVVHAHDTFGIMTWRLDLPRVFTVHGFIHEDTRYRRGLVTRARAWAWKRLEVRGWARQPHIISISPYVRERLRGIARGVIHDVENPVARDCFALPRREKPGHVFCAAVISPRKNTLALVRAFALAATSGDRLRLAGPVTDARYGDELRAEIARLRLQDHVDVLGPLSVDAIRRELAEASIFVLPSLEEGAPMGVAEALGAGVPVIASNRCGLPYMIRDGESGFLIDPTNPVAIAESLRSLLKDAGLRRLMGAAARAHAVERFHPDRVARRTLRIYDHAVAEHRRLEPRSRRAAAPAPAETCAYP